MEIKWWSFIVKCFHRTVVIVSSSLFVRSEKPTKNGILFYAHLLSFDHWAQIIEEPKYLVTMDNSSHRRCSIKKLFLKISQY